MTDTWGRFITSFSEEWLAEELALPAGSIAIEQNSQALSTRVIDGFNGQHGLPRWRDIAMGAGSSVTVRLTGVTLDQLRQAEYQGIGLRRSEGFGRIIFNHPLYPPVTLLNEAGIELPAELKFDATRAPSLIETEERFRKTWRRHLDKLKAKDWQKFRHVEFGSVVRMLAAARGTEMTMIRQALERLKEPAQTLVSLGVTRRDKEAWFRKEGQAGLELLLDDGKLLSILENEVEVVSEGVRENCRRIGLQMLAERIAAQVRQDRK